MYRMRFIEPEQVIFLTPDRCAVIADERVGEAEYLAPVGGVCQAFGISCHGSIEDYFTGCRYSRTERPALVNCSVLKG